MSRLFRYFLVIGAALVSILLFMLASASENSAAFDKHYPWLLGLNALVATSLLVLVLLLLTRLYSRFRRGLFGSKLMTRLVLLFAVVGILPGLMIYLVSVQFVSRSIESWFDVRVEAALESGLNLGRTALESQLADLETKARSIALEIADLTDTAQATRLSRLRGQNNLQEATIVSAASRIVATDSDAGSLLPTLPTQAMLRQARLTRAFSVIESDAEIIDDATGFDASAPGAGQLSSLDAATRLRMRVVVAIPASLHTSSLRSETRFLQLIQQVPTSLAANAESLRAAYSEYQERSLSRTGLRKIYLVTLTLTLLLTIFGAVASAFLIAGDLAQPLLLLAEGTKAVAEGDLSPRPIVASNTELGTLTKSFNLMTRQLSEARASVEKNRSALENAKAYLESVLANMSAGVMVLDQEFKLLTCNDSVDRILQQAVSQAIGQPLAAIPGLASFAEVVTKAFSEHNAQSAGDDTVTSRHWQKQIEVPRVAGAADGGDGTEGDEGLTLLARGSRLPVAAGNGYLIVFDNISDVISAQRSLAWGEVARRLAHEIKNPLTPIQLSAERLQMKLADKLAETDAGILKRATSTIVNQVAAMQKMVNDFRDFARTPPAVLAPLELNALITEILHLYIAGDERDIIHLHLAPNLPQIMGDATQLRQIIHNLLQNAQDAVADIDKASTQPRIDVSTEAVHYPGSDGSKRSAVRLTITDNGPGFSSKILARAFEPYVTSKARGTGLGLAMVKKIIDEHGGRVDIQNRVDGNGAKVLILLLKLAPHA
ncbi:ATP-binding protein [Janthinobacterium sp. 17J80-10]|uniref:sensor histidine kinase n=1 Tax=Janthinobacterium sp. 17J80-10 TaxID=2497863 RepID=UPI0010059998|nr:ATP-binding protein [Janthinobacterium sp. 17J80-10]QAU33157.1 HAMP domain-containing protein [Janthinobacterium sp. 17J80-10]